MALDINFLTAVSPDGPERAGVQRSALGQDSLGQLRQSLGISLRSAVQVGSRLTQARTLAILNLPT